MGNVICPGCIGLYLVEQDAKFKYWSYLYLYRDQASPWHPWCGWLENASINLRIQSSSSWWGYRSSLIIYMRECAGVCDNWAKLSAMCAMDQLVLERCHWIQLGNAQRTYGIMPCSDNSTSHPADISLSHHFPLKSVSSVFTFSVTLPSLHRFSRKHEIWNSHPNTNRKHECLLQVSFQRLISKETWTLTVRIPFWIPVTISGLIFLSHLFGNRLYTAHSRKDETRNANRMEIRIQNGRHRPLFKRLMWKQTYTFHILNFDFHLCGGT